MPEGDTIWRAARALHAALAGHVVTAFRSPLPAVAVCFSAPLVEMLSPAQVAHHPRLVRLGPDVLAPAFPRSEAVERLRARPRAEIGDALLDQTALAGIGNVYKSEVLFLCAVDPFAPIVLLEDEVLLRLVATAEKQMRRNLQGSSRRTASALAGPRFWVYGRAGKACRRCGTPILMRRQGQMARSTYWCPRCQPRRTMPEP